MPAKPQSSSSSSSESDSEPKKTKAPTSPKKTATKTASKTTAKTTATSKTTSKKREPSPKPKKRAASARASPKPKKRAQKASPEPKKRKASPEPRKRSPPKKRKASPPKKRRSPSPKTRRKAESSSYASSRSPSRPPKKKVAARSVSPKGRETKGKKENGEKAKPQARSFLGALAAVKANQKDMPKPSEDDKWDKDSKRKTPWDPSLMCGHPECDFKVCSDRSVSEFFCCGKCSAAFYCKPIGKPEHGKRCEQEKAQKEEKATPPEDPKSGGWTKNSGNRWGMYGNGKSYGKAWSSWKETPKEESKEQTQGLRAWSDDDEPPVPRTNAAIKKAKTDEKEEATKEGSKDSWNKWSSWGDGGYGYGWKKSSGWSNSWSSGWKGGNSWSGSWSRGNQWESKGGKGGKATAMEALSVEEADERRQKRLERFSSNTEASVLNKSDKVCHITWSSDPPEKEKGTDGEAAEKPKGAEAGGDQSDDGERAKQIRTGERARSEDHEDD